MTWVGVWCVVARADLENEKSTAGRLSTGPPRPRSSLLYAWIRPKLAPTQVNLVISGTSTH